MIRFNLFSEDSPNLAVDDVFWWVLWKKDIIGLIRDSLDCKRGLFVIL